MNAKVKSTLEWFAVALVVCAMAVGALLAVSIPRARAIRKYSSVQLGAKEDAVRELLGSPSRVLETQEADAELHRFGVSSDSADCRTLVYYGSFSGVPAYIVLDRAGVVRRVVVIDDDTASALDDRGEKVAAQ